MISNEEASRRQYEIAGGPTSDGLGGCCGPAVIGAGVVGLLLVLMVAGAGFLAWLLFQWVSGVR